MTKNTLKEKTVEELSRARRHLEFSFKRVKLLSLDGELTDPQLETLESFSSRFSRFSDIAIMKYFRTLMLEKDPAFRGSVVDVLNEAEKHSWIASAAAWTRIRELRNLAAHEYSAEEFKSLYQELIESAPTLLSLKLNL